MRIAPFTQTTFRRIVCLLLLMGLAAVPQVAFAASEGGETHGSDEKLPSPIEEHNTDLVIWSLITFGVFLFVLKKVAWRPLITGLDNRESKYLKLLADAEHDRNKAVELLAEYEGKLKAAAGERDDIVAEARRDAERTTSDILAKAQQEAEATRNRALDDIERAKAQAIAEVFGHRTGAGPQPVRR